MMNDYNYRKDQFRSIKAKTLTMAKLDWIREQMLAMGYHLSKSEMLHVVTLEYAKRLEKMKLQEDESK